MFDVSYNSWEVSYLISSSIAAINAKQLAQLTLSDSKVRDLAWAVFGPPLMTQLPANHANVSLPEWRPQLDEENCDILIRLDQNPAALHRKLMSMKSHFLGNYFETLWEFYLDTHPDTEIVAKNHQIHHRGKTQGELDFVIYDKKLKQHKHLELAVKFYLEVKTNENTVWMGPNKIDRLDKKLAKLLTKQLPFSDTQMAINSLKVLDVHHTESRTILKGNLFKHIPNLEDFISQLDKHLPASNYGWLSNEVFDELYERYNKSCIWLPLPKNKWISPASIIDNGDQETSPTSLRCQLAPFRHRAMEEQRPFLVACMKRSNKTYSEKFRVFVTPPAWPT